MCVWEREWETQRERDAKSMSVCVTMLMSIWENEKDELVSQSSAMCVTKCGVN